ncbi:MAG: hypothetical protein AAB477_00275 [Patescibacteria group bacterium]
MPRKTIIIFITVFILIGGGVLGYYYYTSKSGTNNGSTDSTGYNQFNPFGNNQGADSSSNTNGDQNTSDTIGGNGEVVEDGGLPQVLKLHKITDFAVAGATYFEEERLIPETVVAEPEQVVEPSPKTKAKIVVKKPVAPKFEIVPSLRYVERVTGHIYQMYLDNKVESKISNSTIPSIYEATWDSKATSVIYRYLAEDNKTINSFMATLGGAKGEFLPTNITSVSLSPDGTKFFYLTKVPGSVIGYTRAFGEDKISKVFNSPFSEWLSQWASPQKIFLTTKPSSSVGGSLFMLNIGTGSMSKVLGGVLGLTTLANPDGSAVLYNSSTSSGPMLQVMNIDKHTTLDIFTYGLPEKCIWSLDKINIYCAVPNEISGKDYPDTWYQGRISFDDHFVKINTETQSTTEILDSVNETAVDATNLFLSKKEDTLFFINKKDSTLWSLDLK